MTKSNGMTKQQVADWEKLRALGKRKFQFQYGVIRWGLPVAVVWAIAMAAIKGWEQLGVLLPVALIAFPVGGYFAYGAWIWRQSEKRYQAHLESEQQAQVP